MTLLSVSSNEVDFTDRTKTIAVPLHTGTRIFDEQKNCEGFQRLELSSAPSDALSIPNFLAPRAGLSASGQSDTGDLPVAKRARVVSVRPSAVIKDRQGGIIRNLSVDDPTVTNFEAYGGNTTLAVVDNPASFTEVYGHVLERNLRMNNDKFSQIIMQFLSAREKKAKAIQGSVTLSARVQGLR
ncbi:Trehalose-6-P synthase/phosphatase complex synthase subunit [Hypoxylon texense]